MEFYSTYEVRIEGIPNITTRIADSDLLLESFIDEIKKLISSQKTRNLQEKSCQPVVVGVAVEYESIYTLRPAILQICFGTHCVILQLLHMKNSRIQRFLNKFFADEGNIVFVGVGIRNKLTKLANEYPFNCSNNVIELGSLADRVLRTSKLINSGLEVLAREIVGIEIKKSTIPTILCWSIRDLTTKHIEEATIHAYASYAIGNKLLVEGTKK